MNTSFVCFLRTPAAVRNGSISRAVDGYIGGQPVRVTAIDRPCLGEFNVAGFGDIPGMQAGIPVVQLNDRRHFLVQVAGIGGDRAGCRCATEGKVNLHRLDPFFERKGRCRQQHDRYQKDRYNSFHAKHLLSLSYKYSDK